MGVCQSDRNLIDDDIAQLQDEKDKPKPTPTSSGSGEDDMKLKHDAPVPPTMLMARASVRSTSSAPHAQPMDATSSFSFLGSVSMRSRRNYNDKKRNYNDNNQRKESLERKISVLTFASQKIEQYKQENEEYKLENEELNEVNGELKEYMRDKDDIIMQQEQELKEMESKIMRLEQEVFDATRSINDILYKVQGDTVSKLKYSKMSAKRVIFIAGMNDLFYYDETVAAAESNAKCIVVRDIVVCHNEIESVLPAHKAWFLIIGAKRKALFIAESMETRDKWLYFIQNSLNSSVNSFNISSNLQLNHLHHLNTISMSTITNNSCDYLQIPHKPNIVTSPRSGNTKIYIESEEFETKGLCINYPRAVSNCGILNNGHTVQINIHERNVCKLSVNDDANVYRLKQFHFHTPSEHTIYNKQFEMELHLVHVNETNESEILILCFIFTTQQKYKAPPQLQLNEAKTHLLMQSPSGVEMTTSKKMRKKTKKSKKIMEETEDDETDIDEWIHEDNTNGNDFLKQFWHQMPPKKTKEEIPLNSPLNFDCLFKTASDNFIQNIKTNDININIPIYDYVGSLRTPPYTQGVKWLISKKTHFINSKQLNTLKKIWYHYL